MNTIFFIFKIIKLNIFIFYNIIITVALNFISSLMRIQDLSNIIPRLELKQTFESTMHCYLPSACLLTFIIHTIHWTSHNTWPRSNECRSHSLGSLPRNFSFDQMVNLLSHSNWALDPHPTDDARYRVFLWAEG